jgi:hypothetical protein
MSAQGESIMYLSRQQVKNRSIIQVVGSRSSGSHGVPCMLGPILNIT